MSVSTLAGAGARKAAPPRPNVIAEYPLNAHQLFRAEIIERDGRHVVSIARWKNTPSGERRTGQSLEFAAHRTAGVAGLLDAVLHAIASEDAP